MKRALFLVILVLLLSPALPRSRKQRDNQEVRGLWVVRTSLRSPESINKMVDEAADAGFNTLFVQVRGRGDAFYRSKHVSRAEALRHQPDDFDPLGHTVRRARSRGLKVHAWLNTLLIAGFPERPADR